MTRDYETIADAVKERLPPGANQDQRMQVVVDLLWEHLRGEGVSWVGFYLYVTERDEMVLGPCLDKPACSPIGMHGACGQAFRQNKPLLVRDVRELGGAYIACDPRDRCEVVVPVRGAGGRPLGVLDLDSFEIGAFDDADVAGLNKVLSATGLC